MNAISSSSTPSFTRSSSTVSALRREPSTISSMPSFAPRRWPIRLFSPVTMATLIPARRATATPMPSCVWNDFSSSPCSLRSMQPSVSTPSTSSTRRRTRRARARTSRRSVIRRSLDEPLDEGGVRRNVDADASARHLGESCRSSACRRPR